MVATASACLFTKPINMIPGIEIVPPLQKIMRGEPATFTARVTDDQTAQPVVKWASIDGPCMDDPADKTRWPTDKLVATNMFTMFTVDAPFTKAPFCVWAVAIDQYGAAKADNYSAMPGNHPPTARLDVLSPTTAPPYLFQTRFRLSAANSSDVDGDPLTPTWAPLTGPPGSRASLVACDDNPTNPLLRCLNTDVKGDYRVDLTISDATDTGTASVTLTVVEDQLPCIDVTMPNYAAGSLVHILESPGDATAMANQPMTADNFSVLKVSDDLDSWPGSGSQLQFTWSQAVNAGDFESAGPQGSTFSLATGSFHPGDKARVRVEIQDRNNRKDIQDLLLGCQEDTCPVTTPGRAFNSRVGCLLRVTWRVEYR